MPVSLPTTGEREYWKVIAELGDQTLGRGSDGPHLHIGGEAYSDYHAFIEGSLRSAVYLLTRIPKPTSMLTIKERVQDVLGSLLGADIGDALQEQDPALGEKRDDDHLSRDEKYVKDLVGWITKLQDPR